MDSIRTYDGAVALITGAASGLGRALAVEVSRRGASPFLSDLDRAGLEETAALVRKMGVACGVDVIDVRDAAAVRDWVARPQRIDYLFNNAGISGVGGLADRYGPTDWDAVIGVNLRGVVNGVHAGYAVMARQGYGHIVNTASLAGLIPMALALPYSATKHAVVGLSRSLRVQAAAKGVRVSVLCPGVVRTPILTSGRLRGCEDVSEARILEQWEKLRPIDPALWARETLDRVARNEAVITVPRSARVIAALDRFFPSIADRLLRGAFTRGLSDFPELERAPRAPIETN